MLAFVNPNITVMLGSSSSTVVDVIESRKIGPRMVWS